MHPIVGVWRSPVARFVRDEEVVGSNPITPTIYEFHLNLILLDTHRMGGALRG